MYGLYGRVANMAGKGIDKSIVNEDTGKYPLNQILEGKFPKYSTGRLKVRILRSKRMAPVCTKCGFDKVREFDGEVPLLLNYKDGNNLNKKAENLELLCYNCYFLHVNNPFGCRKTFKVDEQLDGKEDIANE
jgi:hypothetical protein